MVKLTQTILTGATGSFLIVPLQKTLVVSAIYCGNGGDDTTEIIMDNGGTPAITYVDKLSQGRRFGGFVFNSGESVNINNPYGGTVDFTIIGQLS